MASEEQTDGGGIPGLGSLFGVQRALGGAIGDVRTIAESVRLIPDLVRVLSSIEKHVASMEREVTSMRGGVEGLGTRVEALEGSIEQMFEPLAEIGLTLHPLRRGASRLSRMGRARVLPVEEPPPEA